MMQTKLSRDEPLVLLAIVLSLCHAKISRVDLNGDWTVAGADITVPGRVPGSMYTALLDSQKIEDPLYRDNDVKLAWVGHENWTYTRSFEVDSDFAQSQTILLVVEGIDTVSTIFLNDQRVGETDNMFIKYSFDVKALIKVGSNSIRISFQSAVDYAQKQSDSYPYPVPPNCTQQVQNGECHVNFIRKEQCSFSWDWGPSFPTQGIWKPIYLEAFNSAVIDMVTVEVVPDANGQGWEVRTKTYFNVSSSDNGSVNGTLDIMLHVINIARSLSLSLTTTRNWAEVNFHVPQISGVKRWWPNGYGNQTLYILDFAFIAANGEVSTRRKRIGFRTIELVQESVSSDPGQGLAFYFRINGFPIFMKGTNWIPADSFQERITKSQLHSLLQAAVEAHINVMRVWGGGVFESEDFYDLADEMGILIWQDLMFSVALYPTDSAFLDTVSREVRYQVRRLMHRPSILLWAGSNENESALRDNWFGIKNFTLYYNDFVKLYVTTIMPIVNSENPDRIYLTSSPSNGQQTVKEGYVATNPGSEYYGDIHFYDYSMDQWRADHFRVPRFASEYGVQAWCNYDTLLDVFQDSDMSYTSTQADHRQHHPGGGSEMEMQITRHLDLPPAFKQGKLRFKYVIYLTQINQAMSIKSQSEHYRRHQSELLPDGRGLTMGALYWQLNDIWQAPTWASIDYSGRWKMLHYYALKFFSPLLVSPFLGGNDLDIFVVVDEIPNKDVRDQSTQRLRMEPLAETADIQHRGSMTREDALQLSRKAARAISGELVVEMYAWNSFTKLHQWVVPYKLNTTAQSVMRRDLDEMLSEAGCMSKEDCFIYTYINDQDSGADNWIYLAELKNSHLQEAVLTITSLRQNSPREFTITLSTTAVAPFVWLESGHIMGRFSDNGFLMHKPTTTVTFTAWEDVTREALQQAVVVYSLADVYSSSTDIVG